VASRVSEGHVSLTGDHDIAYGTDTRLTCFIVDWDDTCLPGTDLLQTLMQSYQYPHNKSILGLCRDQWHNERWTLLEDSLVTGLVALKKKAAECDGTVTIITNAEKGWVELSCQKFLPQVWLVICDLKICSARTTFEHQYPSAPLKWKICAIQNLTMATPFLCSSKKQCVSFGDSHVERQAVREVTQSIESCLTKSVKFSERPSLEHLRRQWEMVASCLPYIVECSEDLDLMMTVDPSV